MAESAWANYRTLLRAYVVPRVGQVRPVDLTPQRLQALYADLLAHGRRDGSSLSARTVAHTPPGDASSPVGWFLRLLPVGDDHFVGPFGVFDEWYQRCRARRGLVLASAARFVAADIDSVRHDSRPGSASSTWPR